MVVCVAAITIVVIQEQILKIILTLPRPFMGVTIWFNADPLKIIYLCVILKAESRE